MIKSFRHKGLKDLFCNNSSKGVQAKHLQKLSDILDLLDAASEPQDMNFSGSGLHKLKGQLKDYWAVKVSGNWRLIFQFYNGDVFDIDYLDYH